MYEAFKGADIMRLAKEPAYRDGFSAGYESGVKVGASLAISIITAAGSARAIKEKGGKIE